MRTGGFFRGVKEEKPPLSMLLFRCKATETKVPSALPRWGVHFGLTPKVFRCDSKRNENEGERSHNSLLISPFKGEKIKFQLQNLSYEALHLMPVPLQSGQGW
jgi:hypothetical protein